MSVNGKLLPIGGIKEISVNDKGKQLSNCEQKAKVNQAA